MTSGSVAARGLAVVALVAAVAGGGGASTEAALVLQLAVAALALTAAARPGPPGGACAAAGLGLALAWSASAAAASYAFGSVVDLTAWLTALVLAWAVARHVRADRRLDPDAGARAWGAALLVASVAVLVVEALGEAGWALGGRALSRESERALGTFFDPNHLGACLVVVAALAASRSGLADARSRLHALVVAGASAFVILTQSRIAPVALALALACAWGFGAGRRRAVAVVAVAALVALGAVVAVVARTGEADAWERPVIWRAVAPAALERPVLGLGPGAFEHVHWRYNLPVQRGIGRFEKRPSTPHGEWLRLPIETGLLGVTALVLLAWQVARWLRRAGAGAPGLALLAGIVPLASVHDVFDVPAVTTWLAFGVAFTGAAAEGVPSAPPRRVERGGALVLAVALAVAVLVPTLVVRPALADLSFRRKDATPRDVERSLWLVPSQPAYWISLAGVVAPADAPADPRRHAVADILLAEAQRLAPRLPGPARERARLAARAAAARIAGTSTVRRTSQLYAEALALVPFDAPARYEAATALLAAGHPEAAEPFLAGAVAIEPEHRAALALRVVVLESLDRDVEAAFARAALEAHLARTATGEPRTSYERQLLEVPPDLLSRARGT